VLGAAEDEGSRGSHGEPWNGPGTSPGPGRPPCRESSSPMRGNAAVVGEAPPELGAAEDEKAMVVTASLGTGRVPPGPGRTSCRETRSPEKSNGRRILKRSDGRR